MNVPYHPSYDAKLMRDLRAVVSRQNSFVAMYLERYSLRESAEMFAYRKKVTPNDPQPAIAYKKLCDAIRSYMPGIKRKGYTNIVSECLAGKREGVDGRGTSMTGFMSNQVLNEVVLMQMVGVFVNRGPAPSDLSEEVDARDPFFELFSRENIINWTQDEATGEFTDLLLRISVPIIENNFVTGYKEGYKRYTIVPEGVLIRLFDEKFETSAVNDEIWAIEKIPFCLIDFGSSQVERVLEIQKSLNNLVSSDLLFLYKVNYPLYTEQYDPALDMQNWGGTQVEAAFVDDSDENKTDTVENATTRHSRILNETDAGVTTGKKYAKGLDRPEFISPPVLHLQASNDKANQFRQAIDKALDVDSLNVRDVRASAESKNADRETLIGGIYNLFMELQRAEKTLLAHFSFYLSASTNNVSVDYPNTFDLRTQKERADSAKDKLEQRDNISSITARRKLTLEAIRDLQPFATEEEIKVYSDELEEQELLISAKHLIEFVKEGAIPSELIVTSMGLDKKWGEVAKKEHAEKIAVVAAAQSSGSQKSTLNTPADDEKKKGEDSLAMV